MYAWNHERLLMVDVVTFFQPPEYTKCRRSQRNAMRSIHALKQLQFFYFEQDKY